MPRTPRQLKPLTRSDLERIALRYVERFATTRGKLADYLRRKVRERGWAEAEPADVAALAQRMADLGYVNDRLYAEAKAGAMGRRGLGARRVREALRHAGVEEADAASVTPMVEESAAHSALAFARRKRIGPYARDQADRPMQEKQLAAMLRAGHALALSRTIVRMAPDGDVASLIETAED